MLGTRPDICFAVCQMAKFAANPSEEHLSRAKYIMKYLRGTKNYALKLDGPSDSGLFCYVDASHGDDQTDPDVYRKSTGGWYFSLAGAAVKWHSSTMHGVSTSSTVSEYMAMSDCECDCAWFRILFSEIAKTIPYVPIYADSTGAIFNAQNPFTGRG